jgi:hypothetical protein
MNGSDDTELKNGVVKSVGFTFKSGAWYKTALSKS